MLNALVVLFLFGFFFGVFPSPQTLFHTPYNNVQFSLGSFSVKSVSSLHLVICPYLLPRRFMPQQEEQAVLRNHHDLRRAHLTGVTLEWGPESEEQPFSRSWAS